MFTKKIEDQFSADLLNTVRSVLGEAKHDKECECEKCEDEDEDENGKKKMKEGFASAAQRKAVWATYADGGKGHPDKKKKMKKEEVELEEGKMKELITKHMDAGHDYGAAMKKAKKDLEKMKEEAEQIDELSSDLKTRYGMKAYDQLQAAQRTAKDSDNSPAIRKLAADTARKRKAGVDRRSRMYAQDVEKQRRTYGVNKEEVEQLDELSPKTLGSYIKKATHQAVSKGTSGGMAMAGNHGPEGEAQGIKLVNKAFKRSQGVAKAADKLTKEEQEFIDALNNDTLEEEKNLTGLPKSTAEKNKQYIEVTHLLGHKKKVPVHPTNAYKALNRYRNDPSTKSARIVSEDVELEEGRGRPPKEGSAAWHAKQKQADDDMVALGMQLRKAKSINKKVRFMDGKEHDIHPNHINRFDDHMAARKTSQDKAAFQKQAHKSHADFVKAVSAPVPKASRDTGEIVKYRH